MQVHRLYNEVLKANLALIVSCNWEEFKKQAEAEMGESIEWEEEKDDLTEGRFMTLLSNDKRTLKRFIWIETFDWTVHSIANLTHELLHWICAVFTDKGIPFCPENEETMAYVLEWAVETTFDKLKPKKKKSIRNPKKHAKVQTNAKLPGDKGRRRKNN